MLVSIIYLLIVVLLLVSMWKVYEKAEDKVGKVLSLFTIFT